MPCITLSHPFLRVMNSNFGEMRVSRETFKWVNPAVFKLAICLFNKIPFVVIPNCFMPKLDSDSVNTHRIRNLKKLIYKESNIKKKYLFLKLIMLVLI